MRPDPKLGSWIRIRNKHEMRWSGCEGRGEEDRKIDRAPLLPAGGEIHMADSWNPNSTRGPMPDVLNPHRCYSTRCDMCVYVYVSRYMDGCVRVYSLWQRVQTKSDTYSGVAWFGSALLESSLCQLNLEEWERAKSIVYITLGLIQHVCC